MSGQYRTIVADPPWVYEQFLPSYTPSQGREHERSILPYSMLTVEEICGLPVAAMAARDCRLFCWTTNRYLPRAFDVVDAWGFQFRQLIVWHKRGRVPPFGGSIAPQHSEYLLVCVKGSPTTGERWPSTVIAAPRGNHSAKPDAFLDLVEQISPGPYVELFARRARFGWDYWGDESLGTAEMPVAAKSPRETAA